MSGASGSFPALIHAVSNNNNLYKIHDGDELILDLKNAELSVQNCDLSSRDKIEIPLSNQGLGRSLFRLFRDNVSSVNSGASIFNEQ